MLQLLELNNNSVCTPGQAVPCPVSEIGTLVRNVIPSPPLLLGLELQCPGYGRKGSGRRGGEAGEDGGEQGRVETRGIWD